MRATRVWLVLASLLPVLLAPACGDEQEARREHAALAARAELDAGRASQALAAARAGFEQAGEDAALCLIAAEACMDLRRYSDAVDYAERGLAVTDDADMVADLNWALGQSLTFRYRELRDDADWRRANSALEEGSRAGSHRVESAFLIVGIQSYGERNNPDREQRFGRKVLELAAPDSSEAAVIRDLFEQRGWTP